MPLFGCLSATACCFDAAGLNACRRTCRATAHVPMSSGKLIGCVLCLVVLSTAGLGPLGTLVGEPVQARPHHPLDNEQDEALTTFPS